MTPVGTVGPLWHANDAAVVSFTENSVSTPYLFIAAYASNQINYIVKLGMNAAGQYWEEARYAMPGDFQFISITLLSGGGTAPAEFLIKNGKNFYTATVANDTPNGQTLIPSQKFLWQKENSEEKTDAFYNLYAAQGIQYESTTDTLYLAFYRKDGIKNQNKILSFSNIRWACSNNYFDETIAPSNEWDITKGTNTSVTFEVEGIGFRPGTSDNRLWFLTYEGSSSNGGIYTDSQSIR